MAPWLNCPRCARRSKAGCCAACGAIIGENGQPEPRLPDVLRAEPPSPPNREPLCARAPRPASRRLISGFLRSPRPGLCSGIRRLSKRRPWNCACACWRFPWRFPWPGRGPHQHAPRAHAHLSQHVDSRERTRGHGVAVWSARLSWSVVHARGARTKLDSSPCAWLQFSPFVPCEAGAANIAQPPCCAELCSCFRNRHADGQPAPRARMDDFGGDAGCMVLGTLLMGTLDARRGHVLARGWLRWGFLVIGAAAFCDAYATWWMRARTSTPFRSARTRARAQS